MPKQNMSITLIASTLVPVLWHALTHLTSDTNTFSKMPYLTLGPLHWSWLCKLGLDLLAKGLHHVLFCNFTHCFGSSSW